MAVPQLSVSTSLDYHIPIDLLLSLIADVGFTHVSLGENVEHSSYESASGRARLVALLQANGLRLDTLHGPRVDLDTAALVVAIESAAELGAPVVVAHGGPFDFPEREMAEHLDGLLRSCETVAPKLEGAGVILALENVLPGPATDLIRLALPRLDPGLFAFCYDSAHDQIGGPRPFDLLIEFGDRLRAVHLSDRVREFVDHVPPGDGFIDWRTLCGAVRVSSFAGPLLLEVMVAHSAEKDARNLLRRCHERALWLAGQIRGDDTPSRSAHR